MKAAVLSQYKHFDWKEVPTPDCGPEDVLLKTTYASICGSDQHLFLGEFHPRTKLPFIPGHEFAGEIVRVGDKVKKFRPGDQITVDPIIWCGKCAACRRGHYPACTSLKLVGIDQDGGFGEYLAVNQSMVYKIPDIPREHAALIEVLSIGFHACNRAALHPNDTAVVWGSGKVGQCVMQAIRAKTTNKLFMVDIVPERLENAKRTYPDIIAINALKEDAVKIIHEETGGDGVDVAFEVVGHAMETEATINPVRGCIQSIRAAGTVCVLGLSGQPAPIVFQELIWKEAKIIASRVTHGEFDETIQNLAAGKLKPQHLISTIMKPEKIQQAFENLEKHPGRYLKILLDFN